MYVTKYITKNTLAKRQTENDETNILPLTVTINMRTLTCTTASRRDMVYARHCWLLSRATYEQT